MAIMIDGAFFINRFKHVYPKKNARDPSVVAKTAFQMACAHLKPKNKNSKKSDLYRVFFYDCPPLTKRVHTPIENKSVNLATSDEAKFRTAIHQEMTTFRKVALRLGHLNEKTASWIIKKRVMTELLKGKREWNDLKDDDFVYYAKQTGVDMRIGVDIALLAQKRLVDQVVLVAGDSDFVPAAKLARREGIDFILDPMWNHIAPDLLTHIDGLRSVTANPLAKKTTKEIEDEAKDGGAAKA
ncbi:NYN domain-containing protein [Thalassospira sp. HJ]|uniref:NYN domain-containing protein n=1 Tax=Thalassospira sp. HJ TaxID=1616823 RepID=UPI00191070BA|nr:NYN domain-containing protein [Thalassospira sp. HJ]